MGGAVGSIVGGLFGGSSASDAADTQSQAAIQAANIQQQTVREVIASNEKAAARERADLTPWRTAGQGGLKLVQEMLGINPTLKEVQSFDDWAAASNVTLPETGMPNAPQAQKNARRAALNKQYAKYVAQTKAANLVSAKKFKRVTPASVMKLDPGYQFRLGEGLRAIDQASAVARGPGLSGATLKELQRYGSDYASDEFGKIFSRASTLSGEGLAAATGSAQFTQAAANSNASAAMEGANAAAAGITGAANAQAAGTIASGNALGGAANNIGQQFYLRQLLGVGG